MTRDVVVFIILCLAVTTVGADQLPMTTPGAIAKLPIITDGTETPRVTFGGRRVLLIRDQQIGHWTAWIGIDLHTPPGEYIALVAGAADTPTVQRFRVRPQRYPVRTHAVGTKKLSLWRPDRWLGATPWRSKLDTKLPLRTPVNGLPVRRFGERELVADAEVQSRNYLEYRSDPNSTIVTPGAGQVTTFVEGGVHAHQLVIDHGQGLFSVLSGISTVLVKPGQSITQGGALGRSDGRALHWGVRLNDAWIDPLHLVW